ncbi:ABC transporter permease subunit [Pseudobacteriovorax antillogorgiicola]|uniref:Microcin C transport system permease protein n=1 Tax=Pseudobacteriovorax antillogorgiicola TaxID=1513793 RepID=A0A1Y6C0R5_9BACT|nr:ABC transporter permease subunit [Pseudobacteriovorax antillogorgiicola]TCS52300.1 microcin C transport system permease protein [Pseudobacteriovorax antillogorgiicola]SMF30422.1 microcin C transport system permease protein [Pseudobacteriovorax antillogorgiicola]
MAQYILRRLLLVPPTFLGITLIVFTITRFVPGGPVERMIAEMQQANLQEGAADSGMDTQLSEEQIQQLNEYYGFDKPILVSYGQWLIKVISGDLGRSSRYADPVVDIIEERLPISIFYGVSSMLITYLVCIPLGIIKAIKHETPLDNVSSAAVFVGYALPSYVVAIILMVYFGSELEWFPLGGFVSDDFEDLELGGKILDVLYHAVLPMTAYIMGSFAVTTFMMKNALMDNLAADFVRTAMAKGFTFRAAVFKHALQNSLIPMATHFGNNISVIIAGSFLIEKIFNIDGFGLLGFESVLNRDYPVVLGILVISSVLQLIGNILSDICVALVDPRVQF